jgi:hypothetical protein
MAKSKKKSLSRLVKRAVRQDQPLDGHPLDKVPIILDNIAVKKFVGRWMEFYGIHSSSPFNELWGVYPLQTMTQEGLQVVPREDGKIIWMLQMHIESDIRWTHLNALARGNEPVTVTEIEISGDIVEVDFIVNDETA